MNGRFTYSIVVNGTTHGGIHAAAVRVEVPRQMVAVDPELVCSICFESVVVDSVAFAAAWVCQLSG